MARTAGSHGAKTAEQIRSAATALFARKGYAAVSMRDIAGEIGIQPGALYHYYAAKQDLLRDLMTAHMQSLLAALKEQRFPLNAHRALETFVRFHIRFHAGRTDEVFLSYMELRNLEPEGFAEIEQLRQRYEQALRDILARGADQGVFEISDIPVAAMALIAMLTGVTYWFRSGGRLTATEIEEIYVRMALGSVASHAEASHDRPLARQLVAGGTG